MRLAALLFLALAATAAVPARAQQYSCNSNADCPWSSCQGGVCEQPPGLSHIAEVQVDAAEVLTPLVNAAARNIRDGSSENICSIAEFDCPTLFTPGLAGKKCIINRARFPGPVTLVRSTTPTTFTEGIGYDFDYLKPQARVPFEIHFMQSKCLTDPSLNCAFSQDDGVASLTAVFEVTPNVTASGSLQVCGHFARAELGTLDVTSMLHLPPIPDKCQPLNQVTALADSISAPIQDVQLSASPDLTRLAARVWFEVPQWDIDLVAPASQNYQSFFSGQLAPVPASHTGWSVFIGQELLLRLAKQQAQNQIQTAAAAQGVAVFLDTEEQPGGFSSMWLPGPFPMAQMSLYLRTDQAGCTFHLRIGASTMFALDPVQHTLNISGALSYDVDIDGCLAGLLPGSDEIVEAYLDGQIPSGTMLGLGGLCSANLNNMTFSCALPAVSGFLPTFTGGPTANVSIEQLNGDANGLVLGGTVGYSSYIDNAATASISGFTYSWDGSCSSQRIGWFGDMDVAGTGRVCSVQRLYDPNIEYVIADSNWSSQTLPKHYELEDYWGSSATYPFYAQVRTTNGSGLLSLPVPDPVSFNTTLSIFGHMKSECYAISTGWLGIPGRYDPHWTPDPPPIDWVASLIDVAGRSFTAVVTLEDAHFTAVGPPQKAMSGTGFSLYQQALRVDATAWVDAGTAGRFTAPVHYNVLMNVSGQTLDSQARLVSLAPADGLSTRLTLTGSTLPAGFRSLTFNVPIGGTQTTHMAGFLPAQLLAGSWTFDDGAGTLARDRSGLGLNGTLVGFRASGWAVDGRNGALSFTPAWGTRVDVPNAPALTPARLTLSAWLWSRTSGSSGTETVLSKGAGSTREYSLSLLTSGRVELSVAGATLQSSAPVSANAWHHVIASYDGTAMRLFVDGRLDATRTVSLNLTDNGAPLTIGGLASTGSVPVTATFNGALDEVRVYGVALGLSESVGPFW